MSMDASHWDHEVELLVVGSGAGAMTAALRAAYAGAKVLIVEKASAYGGTSATSGGGLWITGNHLMADCGIDDAMHVGFDANVCDHGDRLAALLRQFVDQRLQRLLIAGGHDQPCSSLRSLPCSDEADATGRAGNHYYLPG